MSDIFTIEAQNSECLHWKYGNDNQRLCGDLENNTGSEIIEYQFCEEIPAKRYKLCTSENCPRNIIRA